MRAVSSVIVSVVSLFSFAAVSASASAAEPCERAGLVKALSKLSGSAALRVEKSADATRLVDVATKTIVLEATCTALHVPLADDIDAPTKRAVTKGDGRYTVSRTARGALSLGIAAGLAANEALEVLTFDDDSVSVTDARGRVWYSAVTAADGTLTEVEGAHVGCGCERVTTPDGKVVERRR